MDRNTDWMGLKIKYRGKCSVCNKEISIGEYALWSRSNKSIKHQECNNQENIPSFDKKKINLQCYICKNFYDYDHDFEVDMSSDSFFICNKCIDEPNSYFKYQKSFLDSLNKTKVKIMK